MSSETGAKESPQSKEKAEAKIPSIPETIEPGITIPIYDDAPPSANGASGVISPGQTSPQKLGSYRSKAGRFSNKFSSIIPSISAKLHHSSKKSTGHEKDGNGTVVLDVVSPPPGLSTSPTSSLSRHNGTPGTKEKVSIPTTTGIRSSSEHDRLVRFPSASPTKQQLLQQPATPLPRTRTNTVASQYTSLSLNPYGSAPTGGAAANTVGTASLWPTTSNATVNTQGQYSTHGHSGSYDYDYAAAAAAASSSSNMGQVSSQYFNVPLVRSSTNDPGVYDMNMQGGAGTAGSTATGDQGIWAPDAVNRKRSQSMATQVHPEQYFAQQALSQVPPLSQMQQVQAQQLQAQAQAQQMQAQAQAQQQIQAQPQIAYGQMEQYTYPVPPTPGVSAQGFSMQGYNASGESVQAPLLMDDVDPRSVSWVTNMSTVPPINQIQTLLPTNALAITNVYPLQQSEPQYINAVNLTSTALAAAGLRFGTVLSVRTLRDLNVALIEFDTPENARMCLETLQGKDISLPGYPVSIAFAKILPLYQHQSPQRSQQRGPVTLLQEQLFNGSIVFQQQGSTQIPVLRGSETYTQQQQHMKQRARSKSTAMQGIALNANNTQITLPIENERCPFPLPPPTIQEEREVLEGVMKEFDVDHDADKTKHIIIRALNLKETADLSDFGPTPEPVANRTFQTPKLREIRKAIDSNTLSDIEIEQLGVIMLDELPELSFDYLGNTIVQKIYDRSSDIVRDIILRKISKYLTSLGIHKSGTWVCQKMIKLAHNPRSLWLVTEGIKDYCTALFNDQFGNYVIQEVLKFGVPWNNFIFESILANFWIICKNKYGARAIRACLEASSIITTEQTLILSSMIITYGKYLITDNNGTLLITWLLDTCQFGGKYLALTHKILGDVSTLCCHKLGSLTVLKILNSRGNEECRKLILAEIFGDNVTDEANKDQALIVILSDTNYGPTFMHKLLTSRLLDDNVRESVVGRIRNVILSNNISQQNHKLMEEVGLVSVNTSVSQDRSPLKQHGRTPSHQHLGYGGGDGGARRMRGMSGSSVRSGGIPGINVQSMTPVNNGNMYSGNPNININDDATFTQYDPANNNNLSVPMYDLSLNRTISSDATDNYNARLQNFGMQ
ncbi:hypothetical protein DAKH74_055880 [Maudiozyma humilis]|uniref:PUM-HD domain-containing protein n=1 Tax=Maudiozyma humilis TaxID=51915 RepID=A0AAV5S6E9_MAUHU|nr:hypothetical protein DAKH74_055880 [Kazachstania humilis]